MSDPAATPLRETLLRQCLAADPNPWYPRDYAQTAGINRESLYAPLNDLRVANLVQLTDWVPGKGQGYLLTMLGREVLSDPNALAQLRDGPPAAAPSEAPVEGAEPTTFDIGEAARRAFFAPGRVRVVPVLIVVNLVAFAASFAVAARAGIDPWEFLNKGSPTALERAGALTAPGIAHSEWWRLVTNCFLHFGLMHLFLNMTTLFLCRRVEVIWGSSRFLALYLISGVCGSCVAVYYNPGEDGKVTVLAGASGALWGVMMSEVVWLLLNRAHLPPESWRPWMSQLSITLLINVGVSMLPNVSAAAHFGGGIAGILAAFLLRVQMYGPPAKRSMASVLLLFLPVIFLLGLSVAMDSDRRLQPFVADVYRQEIGDRVGKLPARLDELEPPAERLFLQTSGNRDPAEVSKLREDLKALVKQAKQAGEWAKKTDPVEYAKPMRERGLALVEALVPFAEALDKQAGGEVVQNMNDLRNDWREARAAWEKVIAK
jgi:membrane associated rhomboid family serine protease